MLKTQIALLISACTLIAGSVTSGPTPNTQHMYSVILAGGKGERLWPLSRENKPKQFLEFLNKKTLVECTIDRITPLMEAKNIWIITHELYTPQVRTILGDTLGGIISEPASRNTAPAILLACLTIMKHDPEATLAFLPADHYIKEEAVFTQGLQTALDYVANNDVIALIGLQPTYPATGLGYIEYTEPSDGDLYRVVRFHEKPKLALAQEYIKNPHMLWNGGYFCGKAKTFITLFKQYTPHLYEQVQGYLNHTVTYEELADISFDNAIMERATNICVLPLEITWSDVGNLKTFLSAQDHWQDQLDNVIAINASNNLIHNTNKFTALIGVDDLCIINTDDVLIVAHQKDVERVKEILAQLRKTGKNELRSRLPEFQP